MPAGIANVHVKSTEFTGPAVMITFVPAELDGESEDMPKKAKGEVVVVPDRGEYELSLRPRSGNEKMRYSLVGF